jgi:hypothetical protein
VLFRSLFPLPLPSPQLRDLNDEINKLIREKRHWERQIKSLGGPSYKAAAIERDVQSSVARVAAEREHSALQ